MDNLTVAADSNVKTLNTAIAAINAAIKDNGVLEPDTIVAISAAIVLGIPPVTAKKPLDMESVSDEPGTWPHYAAAIKWVVLNEVTLDDPNDGKWYYFVLASMRTAFSAELTRMERQAEEARLAAEKEAEEARLAAEKEAEEARLAAEAQLSAEEKAQRTAEREAAEAKRAAREKALQGLEMAGNYVGAVKPVDAPSAAKPVQSKPVAAPKQPQATDKPSFNGPLTPAEVAYRFKTCNPGSFEVMAQVFLRRTLKTEPHTPAEVEALRVEITACCVSKLTQLRGTADGNDVDAKNIVDGFIAQIRKEMGEASSVQHKPRQQGGHKPPQYSKGQNTAAAKPAPVNTAAVVESPKDAAASDETESPKDKVDHAAVEAALKRSRAVINLSDTPKEEGERQLSQFEHESDLTKAEFERQLNGVVEKRVKHLTQQSKRDDKNFGEQRQAAPKKDGGKDGKKDKKPGRGGRENGHAAPAQQ